MINTYMREDEVSCYVKRLKSSNEKLEYWYEYLCKFCNAKAELDYNGVSIWDVNIASLSVLDHFVKTGILQDEKKILKSILRIAIKAFTLFFQIFSPVVSTDNTNVVFVAFERRHVNAYLEIMKLLNSKQKRNLIVTTAIPSHQFPLQHNENTYCLIENYIGLKELFESVNKYLRINNWLKEVNERMTSLSKQEQSELSIVTNIIKTNLLNVLFLIDASRIFLDIKKPHDIVAVDNADPRARALFINAKIKNIRTHHLTYGFVGYDCFEERYLVADKKYVFGQKQKELIVDNFNVKRECVVELGAPRFDNLFKLRLKKLLNKKPRKVIFLGSQPSTISGYGCIDKEYKLEKIRELFEVISKSNKPIEVLIKYHPDETVSDKNEIEKTAIECKIDYKVIDNIDFEGLMNVVSLFITFHSNLAIEFMILGIPVCYMISVKNIPILFNSINHNISAEALNRNEMLEVLKKFLDKDEDYMERSRKFLESEFFSLDGNASKNITEILIK